LVEVLLAFTFEEDFVGLAVFLVEIDGSGNVEVVLKAGYVEEDGMTTLSCPR